jgi:hypothetical protein
LSELKQNGALKPLGPDNAFRELIDLLGVDELDALGKKYTGQ